jgi:hypothetical protein
LARSFSRPCARYLRLEQRRADASGRGTNPGAALAFPTDQTNNVIFGALEEPSIVTNPVGAGAVVNSEGLTTVPYDVYVPSGHNGSEPYGLIAFINSEDNGGAQTMPTVICSRASRSSGSRQRVLAIR